MKKISCDRCGKDTEENSIEIDLYADYLISENTDLCKNCIGELQELINQWSIDLNFKVKEIL